MKPQLLAALFARDLIVDAHTGTISLIRIMERLIPNRLPSVMTDFEFFSLWTLDSGTATVRAYPINPKGERVFHALEHEVTLRSSDKKGMHRLSIHLAGLRIDQSGEWRMNIEYQEKDKWIKIGHASFFVDEPEAAQPVGLSIEEQTHP